MLEARRLTKFYGLVCAVKDIDFRVDSGEILGCLGPNGSGKSTTMKMLTGLIEPTRGEVLFAGERINTNRDGFKRRLGYVPEESSLYPYLSGLEYLELIGTLRGIAPRTLDKKADALLDLFALHGQRHSLLGTYSKGMRQKILIIAALLHDPEVLVFDEPLTGLDVTSSLVFRNLLRILARAGKTILYCSHVIESVEKICSRVIILYRGRIIANNSIEKLQQLMSLPSLEHVFGELVQLPDTEQTARDIFEVMKA
jgi:ABC-2 type transport system ATP-binding protein